MKSSVKDFFILFGANFGNNDRGQRGYTETSGWEVSPIIPGKLVILANLIDMTYNFTSKTGYHSNHFSDIDNVRANTSGFIATHMFAEYLSRKHRVNGKTVYQISYEQAIEEIASATNIL